VRRSKGHAQSVINTGDLVVNLDTKTVEVGGQRVHLTGKRIPDARAALAAKGHHAHQEMFLNHLYGGMDEPELKIIDVFICKLRKKLANASSGKNYIETVWGRGYVLREPHEQDERIPLKRYLRFAKIRTPGKSPGFSLNGNKSSATFHDWNDDARYGLSPCPSPRGWNFQPMEHDMKTKIIGSIALLAALALPLPRRRKARCAARRKAPLKAGVRPARSALLSAAPLALRSARLAAFSA